MFCLVFSLVHLTHCSQPSCVCAGRHQHRGLRQSADKTVGKVSKAENEKWKTDTLQKPKRLTWSGMSGKGNKWGVKAELACEDSLSFRTQTLRTLTAFARPMPALSRTD